MMPFQLSNVAFEPLLPTIAIMALAVAGLIALGIYVWRKGRAPILRSAALATLFLAVGGPSFVREDRVGLPDIVAIVIDSSESMALAGRSDGAEAALTALQAKLAAVPNLDVRIARLSDTASGTSLSPALDQVLADAPPERVAGAFVISDGLFSDPNEAARPFPVHQVIIGAQNERDRRIIVKNAPRSAPIGEVARIVIQVDDTVPSAQISVHIGEQPAQVRDVPTGQDITIEIPIDRRGSIPIAIETPVTNDEVSGANNAVALAVSGVRDRLRVMLVTGEPYAGARAWRNLLKSDPSVDLVQFTILRSPEKQDYTPVEELSLIQFPTRELFLEKINSFDLVVFDRFERISVLPDEYLESVARWVEDGGAFLMLAGPAEAQSEGVFSTPLARVIPASPTGKTIETPFRPQLTQRGLTHPVSASLSDQAPIWGQWLRVQASNPRGDVLLEGNGQPLLVISQVGKGRSAAIMSDQAWLWRRGYDGGGPFDELFRRTAHWLMKEADLEADRLLLRSALGKLFVERQATLDPGIATIDAQDGRNELVLNASGPNSWRGELAIKEPGLSRVQSGDKQAFIIAGIGNPVEARALKAMSSGLFDAQSKAGGGAVAWVGRDGRGSLSPIARIGATANARGNSFELRATNASSITSSRRDPLIPAWIYALFILVFSLSAWWREGR